MDDDKEIISPELDLEEDSTGEVEAEVAQDEDLDDVEPEEDAEPDEGEEEDKEEPDARSRASSRISKLANERKAERERAEKAERDVAALRAQMEEVQNRLRTADKPDPRAEAELLAQMDPVERVQYESQKQINALQSQIRSVQLASMDNADKAEFLKGTHKDLTLRSKYVGKVEESLADMRKKGLNAPRDEIYAYLVGKAHIERMQKGEGTGPERRAAQKRVTDTQGKTTSIRSDAAGGRKGKTAEERLSDVIL